MDTYGLTHPGNRRETNEDAVLINDNIGLLVLADGMGGHAAGDVASQIAVEVINDALEASINSEDAKRDDAFYLGALRAAIARANTAIYEQGQSEAATRGMGSTVVAALVRNDRLYVAHVGDSRLYRYSDARFERLTRDHSKVQELVDAGQVRPQDARRHALANLLTRSLGPYPRVESDVAAHAWDETQLILLCSDGLTGELDDEQLQQALETYSDIKDKCRALVGQALEGAASDNVSLLIGQGSRFAPQPTHLPDKLIDLKPEQQVARPEPPVATPRPPVAPPKPEPVELEPEFASRPGDRSEPRMTLPGMLTPHRRSNRLQIILIAAAIVAVLIALLTIPIVCDHNGGQQSGTAENDGKQAEAGGDVLFYLLYKDDALTLAKGTTAEAAQTIKGTDSLVWDNMGLVIRGRGFNSAEGGAFFKAFDNEKELAAEALAIYSAVIEQALELKTADGMVLALTALIQVQQNPLLQRDAEAVRRLELETFAEAMPILDEVLKAEYEVGGAWIARTDRVFQLAERAFELEGERLGQFRSRQADYHYYQGLYYETKNIPERALARFKDARQLGTSFPDVDQKIAELESRPTP